MDRDRVILHVDMDAFFAQAEILAAPALRGRPLVIGGRPGERGVVATASYEARVYGVRSGMSLTEAARRCPKAVFLPCHPSRYFYLSAQIRKLLLARTPVVEMASIDEAFLDPGFPQRSLEEGESLARAIQTELKEKLSLSCSIGVGENKLIAKMASPLGKPEGITVLSKEDFVLRFADEPVIALYGVGNETARKLQSMGIQKVGELSSAPDPILRIAFGVLGPVIAAAARGEDKSPVVPSHQTPEPKSMGHEMTLVRDEADREKLMRVCLLLCDEVAYDLRSEGWMARTIQVRIRGSDFTTVGRQGKLSEPTDSTRMIFRLSWRHIDAALDRKPVRLLGVRAGDLVRTVEARTMDLLDDGRGDRFELAADHIRNLFGHRAIGRASLMRTTRA